MNTQNKKKKMKLPPKSLAETFSFLLEKSNNSLYEDEGVVNQNEIFFSNVELEVLTVFFSRKFLQELFQLFNLSCRMTEFEF